MVDERQELINNNDNGNNEELLLIMAGSMEQAVNYAKEKKIRIKKMVLHYR